MKRPIIGITPEAINPPSNFYGPGFFSGISYSKAIEEAGGAPVVLPLTNNVAVLDQFLARCDGILLSGGGDMGPNYYHPPLTEAEKELLVSVNNVRDEMELYLLQKLIDMDLPVLGVCRGIQVMNIAFGGTLIPDITLRNQDALQHQSTKPEALSHGVHWNQTGKLTQLLGAGFEKVNSGHHQAIDQVADNFITVATSPDGIVEAIELPSARFFCGVQFHPERLLQAAPRFLRFFELLVQATNKTKLQSSY